MGGYQDDSRPVQTLNYPVYYGHQVKCQMAPSVLRRALALWVCLAQYLGSNPIVGVGAGEIANASHDEVPESRHMFTVPVIKFPALASHQRDKVHNVDSSLSSPSRWPRSGCSFTSVFLGRQQGILRSLLQSLTDSKASARDDAERRTRASDALLSC